MRSCLPREKADTEFVASESKHRQGTERVSKFRRSVYVRFEIRDDDDSVCQRLSSVSLHGRCEFTCKLMLRALCIPWRNFGKTCDRAEPPFLRHGFHNKR
jgi:hypothetical protein